jgi:hypothetical protein
MNVRRAVATVSVTAAALSGVSLLAPAAEASGGGNRVIKTGSCSGSADWKLKAKPDDGRLEIEFEVDSNRTGQSWSVRVTDNGSRVFSGRRTTHGRSGSFSLNLRPGNRSGQDTVKARATHAGQTCVGTVRL